MKPNLLLKLCAVASSLLLAVGFVSYRAGALDWLSKPAASAIETPTAPEYIFLDGSLNETPAPPKAAEAGDQLLWSSKSGTVFGTRQTTTLVVEPSESVEESPVIFSGSKSLMPAPSARQK